ncbi:MAG TPA: hypothetical protein VMC80_02825 [Patescibacteria group bacterium]|nr:hypothetical protein [Patescibacteria group bacterium]
MKIVLTPDWFLGKDVLIDFFSFVILFIFLFLCVKNYKLDKNKKLLYLGIGFGLVGLAELASIFTKLVLYYDTSFTRAIGQLVVTYHVVSTVDVFYYLGFFFFRFFTLAGLYVIYKLPLEGEKKTDFLLSIFFIFVISILSQNMDYLFRLTEFVLLAVIIRNYYFVYKKNRSKKTLILLSAFSILAISNLIYLFSGANVVYVIADLMELVSYLTMLVLIIKILKYGKEKKSNGHHFGHFRNNSAKGREY